MLLLPTVAQASERSDIMCDLYWYKSRDTGTHSMQMGNISLAAPSPGERSEENFHQFRAVLVAREATTDGDPQLEAYLYNRDLPSDVYAYAYEEDPRARFLTVVLSVGNETAHVMCNASGAEASELK